jgi:hypothetical protein
MPPSVVLSARRDVRRTAVKPDDPSATCARGVRGARGRVHELALVSGFE